MRSPSPSMKPKMAAAYPRKAVVNLDMMEDSEISEFEMEQGNEPGVRYITESLIQKLSKQQNLAYVISLNLSLSKEGGKKFKFIENLEKCEKLEVLNLSYNIIEKIEKLEKQSRLRELNLSHNRIRYRPSLGLLPFIIAGYRDPACARRLHRNLVLSE
ncbi:centriolin-like isoform X2 [Hyperolius riggenbachi]